MSKLFYTDPLAAAWMAKHFGMRFCYEGTPIGFGTFSDLGLFESENPLEIHADSLHLLEPREGDLLAVRFTSPALPMISDSGFFLLGCPWEEAEFDLDLHDFKIIQRNGIAFHWPESEGA